MTDFEWLQKWYHSQCDGDWEHEFGVTIETLDNPGWCIDVQVSGTALEGRAFDPIRIERSEHDWIHCKIEDDRFKGFGGAENLLELVKMFRDWAEANKIPQS